MGGWKTAKAKRQGLGRLLDKPTGRDSCCEQAREVSDHLEEGRG